MGKPINTKPTGCVTTSSNCVVWQGPDISFLDLCTGDTVSDVIAGLADNICLLLNYTNVGNYDTSQISTVSPTDYIALLQLIIDQIELLKDSSPSAPAVTACCPDVFDVSTNAFFQGPPASLDPVVDLVTYTTTIANIVGQQNAKITQLMNSVSTLQATVVSLQSQIDALT